MIRNLLNIFGVQNPTVFNGLKKYDPAVRTAIDPPYYLRVNPDVVNAKFSAGAHFAAHGASEGRLPHLFFSDAYVYNSLSKKAFYDLTAAEAYLNSDLHSKPLLIFVSHDATRTGAPAIILRLLEMFSDSDGFECFSILKNGGERLAEFKKYSHCYVLNEQQLDPSSTPYNVIGQLLDSSGLFKANKPLVAFVNSAESALIGEQLHLADIPVVSLIHEIADYYEESYFETIFQTSRKVIFPSEFVASSAQARTASYSNKSEIVGQGLLIDGFGQLDQTICRSELRNELQIEDDAKIVLNVGTVDLRKGGDLFVDTAKLFFETYSGEKPVYFVWFGQPDPQLEYPHRFLLEHGLHDRVRFLPPTSDIERVFVGADIFFLCARADPFPCVVHEAMACGLPVIAFKGGGGAPELIEDDCGTIVEMYDLPAVAGAIENYIANPDMTFAQSENSKSKIRKHWQFADYQKQIYDIAKQNADDTSREWPTISPKNELEHLVAMGGSEKDKELFLRCYPKDKTDDALSIVLIDGRLNHKVGLVGHSLAEDGYSIEFKHPVANTLQARRQLVSELLISPKPRELTLVNLFRFASLAELKLLDYPVNIIETGYGLDVEALYACLPFLKSLVFSNHELAAELKEMNPTLASRIHVLENNCLNEPWA